VLGKALGAIAALQQEAVAFRHIGEMLLQTARFTCKDERRIRCKLRFRCCQLPPDPDIPEPAGSVFAANCSGSNSVPSHSPVLSIPREPDVSS
jgi:hypothetical protein